MLMAVIHPTSLEMDMSIKQCIDFDVLEFPRSEDGHGYMVVAST